MPDFLEQRRRIWYANWDVPRDCRHLFNGKARMIQSLKTDSRREALVRVRPLVDQWKAIAERARSGGEDRISARAAFWRATFDRASEVDREILRERIAHEAENYQAYPGEGDDPSDFRADPDALRFYDLATGRRAETNPLIDAYLGSRPLSPKTQQEYRKVLELLAQQYPTLDEVDRRKASQFVERVLTPGRSAASVQKAVSALIGFWKWAQNKGHYAEGHRNPWSEQAPPKPRKRGTYAKDNDRRRPFTEDEAKAFMSAVLANEKRHPADGLAVMLMAVTGARLEEVCGLHAGDVAISEATAWVIIREGKTAASSRRIPVVAPRVVDALRLRLPDDPDLPLFPEFGRDRYEKRSQPLSKRLGRLLRKHVNDPRLVAAHGWRHRGRDLVDKKSIEPWVADWFFGHARPGEGLKTYAPGSADVDLLRVAHAIPLPEIDVAKPEGR